VLKLLGKNRVLSTQKLPIGGGKDFPTAPEAQQSWAQGHRGSVSEARAMQLLLRYGTRAKAILEYIAANPETMLTHNSGFSDSEIEYLVINESVYRLEDLVNRRTNLAFTGLMTTSSLKELASILQKSLGWEEGKSASEVSGIRIEAGSRI
jgi:glycerol-3-phosphate dehydrogenase